jgi:PAS domain-containing protein
MDIKEKAVTWFLENSHEAFLLAELASGKIIQYNKKASALLGLDAQGINEPSLNDFFKSLGMKKNWDDFYQTLSIEKNLQLETTLANPLMEMKIITIQFSYLNSDGKEYLNIIFRDISNRKKVEKDLIEKVEFMRFVMDSFSYPFYIIDANTYEIIYGNELYRKTVQGRKGTTCHELTHESPEPCTGCHICPLDKVKATKKKVVVEHIHTVENGEKKYFEVHGVPILDKEGKMIQMVEYSIDINDRKLIQINLEEKISELQIFKEVTVDREIKMLELKREVNSLLVDLGKPEKYSIY